GREHLSRRIEATARSVNRLLVYNYKPAAQRELAHMDRSDAKRIIHALEAFAATGRGDVPWSDLSGCHAGVLAGVLRRMPVRIPAWQPGRLLHGAMNARDLRSPLHQPEHFRIV